MELHRPTQSRSASARRSLILFLSAAGLAVVVVVCLLCWPGSPQPETASSSADPRLTFATPYHNVRPEVAYVGDDTCAQCHPDQATTYRQHPMGRSFAPVARAPVIERFDATAHNPFEAFGLHFQAQRRDSSLMHTQTLRGFQGQKLAESETEVHYAIGSGTRGRSYFTSREGYLFQTPLSWFSQKGIWDSSPGFNPRMLGGRPIPVDCVFCHTNHADWVEHTINHFRPPIFRGYAIGCERCHGPGTLHVQRRERGEVVAGLDDTIVNPSRLEPLLRESVCQQCHLEGAVRVLRRGRGPFDYRPGLPFHLFWSVLVEPPEFSATHHAVSHVEQMQESRCYLGSKGQLGCISCHEPHRAPAAEEKAEFFRTRCLTCHEERGCRFPLAQRRAQQPPDNCIACHMPRFDSSDIAHTAVTDHRVPRRTDPAGASKAPTRRPLPGELPLVHFYRNLLGPQNKEADRDLALALVEKARQTSPPIRQFGPVVLPWLEAAVQTWPDDVRALGDKGYALWLQGRAREALAVFEKTLALAPQREITLIDAATLATQLEDRDAAVAYFRRLVAINPWAPLYRYELAKLLAQREDWPGALEQCQTELRLYPAHPEARVFLVTCYLRTGKREQAQAEFEKVLAASPPSEEPTWRRWLAEQVR